MVNALKNTVFISVIIISTCFALIVPVLNAGVSPQKKAQHSKETSINTESKWENVPCSFELIGKFFSEHEKYYPDLIYNHNRSGWLPMIGKYNCNKILNDIILKERKRWNHSLKPQGQDSGIMEGKVIAYGTIINPPYNIVLELNNQKLFINNVKVKPSHLPSVLPPNNSEKIGEQIVKVGERIDELEVQYKALRKKQDMLFLTELVKLYGKEEGLKHFKESMKLLSKDKLILFDFWIYDEDKLLFDIKLKPDDKWDVPAKYFYSPEEWKQKTKEDPFLLKTQEEVKEYYAKLHEKNWREYLKELSKEIPNALSEHKVVIFHKNDIYYMDSSSFEVIEEIMQSDSLDELSKINYISKVLDKHLNSRGNVDVISISKELVFNIIPSFRD